MAIDVVTVFGAGTMGSGIAQVCAQAGCTVRLVDVGSEALDKARTSIARSVAKLVEKGEVKASVDEVLGRIGFGSDDSALAGTDLVVEAVFEQRALKHELMQRIDHGAPAHALIASNTSALSITELASATGRPDQVLGLHFFNPVPLMGVVEVVRGALTSEATLAAGRAFVESLGKQAVLVQRDVPGFLVNRINLPSSLEAMRLVEQGVASVEDIDTAMKLATGRKMGIFETGDLVGLDVTHGALTALYEETREERWYPPLILRRKVTAGELGKKTGKGWYCYDANGQRLPGH